MKEKIFKEDLHLHTTYSPDARDSFTQMIEGGIDNGATLLCVTDHLDIDLPGANIDQFRFEERNGEYEKLKVVYADKVKLLLGLEFAEPNLHYDRYQQILSDYPYDMIIGSVHVPMEMLWHKMISKEEMTVMQYARTKAMALKGGFDVLGHLDFPKKFVSTVGTFHNDDEAEREILRIIVDKGIVLEINTSTLYRGLTELCPRMEMIEYYRDIGGKYVTVGSDSHTYDGVAKYYDLVAQSLPKGLEIVYFEKRKLVRINK